MDFDIRLGFWLVFVLLGLMPVGLARVKTAFAKREFDTDAFFRDGSLLFFGPAVLMVTIGEMMLKRVDRESPLLMMSLLVIILLMLAVASTVYHDLFREERRTIAMQPGDRASTSLEIGGAEGPQIGLVRQLTWALTITTLVISFSLTAVFNWRAHPDSAFIQNQGKPVQHQDAPKPPTTPAPDDPQKDGPPRGGRQ